jgi:hypothetical protein
MRHFFYFLIGSVIYFSLGGCANTQILRTRKPTVPVYSIQPEHILLINAADIASQKYRDGKEELFLQILDKTLLDLSREIKLRIGTQSVIHDGFLNTGTTAQYRDSLVRNLMVKAGVSDAIVIQSFDTYFYKHDVEVVENPDGTRSREVKYDLESDIRYLWYARTGLFQDKTIHVSRFHSSRSAISGALAVGPNIVVQQSDAYAITEENVIQYLNMFLPGYEFRSRVLFTGGEFKEMKKAYDSQNFEQALLESTKLVNHPKARTAAQANYNCAVLCESLGQYNQIKRYLVESNRLHPDINTSSMLEDY